MPTTPPAIGHPRWRQPAIDEEGSRSGRGRGGKSGLSRSFCVAAPMERGQCAYWHLLITWPLGGKPPAHRDGWPCWRGRRCNPWSRRSWRALSSQQEGGSRNLAEKHGQEGSLVGPPKVSPPGSPRLSPSWFRSVRAPSGVSSKPWEVSELPRELLSAPLCPLCPLDVGESWRGEAYGEPE